MLQPTTPPPMTTTLAVRGRAMRRLVYVEVRRLAATVDAAPRVLRPEGFTRLARRRADHLEAAVVQTLGHRVHQRRGRDRAGRRSTDTGHKARALAQDLEGSGGNGRRRPAAGEIEVRWLGVELERHGRARRASDTAAIMPRGHRFVAREPVQPDARHDEEPVIVATVDLDVAGELPTADCCRHRRRLHSLGPDVEHRRRRRRPGRARRGAEYDERERGKPAHRRHDSILPMSVLLLTGPPGSGKTTALRRAAERLRSRRLGGFYTEEIRRHGGGRLGFRAVTFDDEVWTLARVDRPGPPRGGGYGVDGSVVGS